MNSIILQTDNSRVGFEWNDDRFVGSVPDELKQARIDWASGELHKANMLFLGLIEAATISPAHMNVVLATIYRDLPETMNCLGAYFQRLDQGESTYEEILKEICSTEGESGMEAFRSAIDNLDID